MDPLENNGDRDRYRSFLLRLWMVDEDGEHAWRITIDEPVTSMHRGFTNISDLIAYLIEVICDIKSGNEEER
jgi:hypothetical protein